MWRIINAFPVTLVGLEHHFQLRSLNADGLAAVFDKEFSLMIFGCHSTPLHPTRTPRATPMPCPAWSHFIPTRPPVTVIDVAALIMATDVALGGFSRQLPFVRLSSSVCIKIGVLPIHTITDPHSRFPLSDVLLASPVTGRCGLMAGSLLSLLVP